LNASWSTAGKYAAPSPLPLQDLKLAGITFVLTPPHFRQPLPSTVWVRLRALYNGGGLFIDVAIRKKTPTAPIRSQAYSRELKSTTIMLWQFLLLRG
jgi:hypothetical protein